MRHRGRKGLAWLCFGLLCLIGASQWLLADARPEWSSTLSSESLGCASAGAACLLYFERGRTGDRTDLRRVISQACGTALFLAAPAVARIAAGRHLDSSGSVAALLLSAIPIAVAASAMNGDDADVAGRFWPALAGLAGFLLLAPEPALGGAREWLAYSCLPVLTGLGAVLFSVGKDTGEEETITATAFRARNTGVATGCAVASCVFALTALSGPGWQGISWVAVVTDAGTTFLSLLTLSELGATRWSAQFLMIPLLTITEGLLLLRPGLTARFWVGLVLLAIGAARQCFSGVAAEENLALGLRGTALTPVRARADDTPDS